MNIPKSRSIPVEYIKECFEYREEEVDGVLQGNVYWKNREDLPNWWNTKYTGKRIKNITTNGYYAVSIRYNNLSCPVSIHTIIWILNHGCYPDDMLDHKDNNRLNNLISNLRPADAYLNNLNTPPISNRQSQYKGVTFTKDKFKWRVKYSLNGKLNHVGYFVDELEAALAYNQAISKVHNTEYAYMNDISMGYTNQVYPNMPRHYEPEKVAA